MVSRMEAMKVSYILQTNHLTKTIGGKELVSNVNLHIKKGEIYGFLGLNGAGKTTVMKMVTNLWKPTSGKVEIFGKTLTPKSYEVLKRMGSIIELSKMLALNDVEIIALGKKAETPEDYFLKTTAEVKNV